MPYELLLSARARALLDQLEPSLRKAALKQLAADLPTERDLVTVERLDNGAEYWVAALPDSRLEVAYGPIGSEDQPTKLVLYAIRPAEQGSASRSSDDAEGGEHE